MKHLLPFPKHFGLIAASAIALMALTFFAACAPKEITAAKIYIQSNDWNKAVEQLELAVNEHQNNAEAHYLLGQAHGQLARFKAMNDEFNISLTIADKFEQQIRAERERHWTDRFSKATLASNADDHGRAEMLLRDAITIDSSRQETYKKLALTYLNMDKPDRALTLYLKLLERTPNDIDLLASTGNLYYGQKDYSQVIPVLKRILELEPNHRDALANLALSYDALGEEEQAANAYERAIAANPDDIDLIFLYGVHHYNRQKYPDAIRLFEQVLASNPDDFESVSNIGNAYLSMAESIRLTLRQSREDVLTTAEEVTRLRNEAISHYKNAIPYLERSLELQDAHPALWRNLGIAYINTGDRERGQQAFLKAEDLQVKSSK